MSSTIRWPDGAKFGRGLRQDHDVELLMTSAEATAASRPAAPSAAALAAAVHIQPPPESSSLPVEAPKVQPPKRSPRKKCLKPAAAVAVAGRRLDATSPRVSHSGGAFRPVLALLGPALLRRTTATACRLSGMKNSASGRIAGSSGFKYI